jgi:hypothetical protein
MKKLLVTTVAALALMGAVASDANAFGISISFGGFRFHHVGGRHHYGSTRHHRSETRVASRRGSKPTREAKAEKTETKLAPGVHMSAKEEVPAMARTASGEQRAADAAWQTYMNLPQAFRESVGPVAIYTFANIADFRRITQIYGARDTAAGYSTAVMFKDAKTDKDFFCRVNLIGHLVDNDMAMVLTHELGHCVDFQHKIGHSMPLMEAFFLDSTKETKVRLIADGFEYYTTEPQEAFAQAIAHYLMPSVNEDYSKWEADWPHLNAHVRKLLDDAKIAYISPSARMATAAAAAEAPVTASIKTEPVPVAPLDY